MDCSTHNSETAGPSLLALIDAQGGDMGATLLRLAHRAAAAHRFEHATRAMRDATHASHATHATRAGAVSHHNATIQSSGAGGAKP